jgi:hypothetical protein
MSQRKIVMFRGKLEGMNRVADCTVSAVRRTLPGTGMSALSRITIHQAPADLPEGRYTVTYSDGLQTAQMAMQKTAVGWIAANPS